MTSSKVNSSSGHCSLPPWRRPITTVVSGLNLAEGLAVGGDMAYVATGHERKVLRFDLSTPANPSHLATGQNAVS